MDHDLDAIVPDDKDWTWVVERACPECGFDGSRFRVEDIGEHLRANAAAWAAELRRPVEDLRRRPDPARWTDLEYGAHVRDVYRLYRHRLGLMLQEDDPLYPNWDQDETARADRYNEQDPVTVSEELVAAAHELADEFDRIEGDQWRRRGRRSDGASFTVDTFARYLVHDPVHHLVDLTSAR